MDAAQWREPTDHFKSFSNFNAWLIVFKFNSILHSLSLFLFFAKSIALILDRGRSAPCPHHVWPAFIDRRRCMP